MQIVSRTATSNADSFANDFLNSGPANIYIHVATVKFPLPRNSQEQFAATSVIFGITQTAWN